MNEEKQIVAYKRHTKQEREAMEREFVALTRSVTSLYGYRTPSSLADAVEDCRLRLGVNFLSATESVAAKILGNVADPENLPLFPTRRDKQESWRLLELKNTLITKGWKESCSNFDHEPMERSLEVLRLLKEAYKDMDSKKTGKMSKYQIALKIAKLATHIDFMKKCEEEDRLKDAKVREIVPILDRVIEQTNRRLNVPPDMQKEIAFNPELIELFPPSTNSSASSSNSSASPSSSGSLSTTSSPTNSSGYFKPFTGSGYRLGDETRVAEAKSASSVTESEDLSDSSRSTLSLGGGK